MLKLNRKYKYNTLVKNTIFDSKNTMSDTKNTKNDSKTNLITLSVNQEIARNADNIFNLFPAFKTVKIYGTLETPYFLLTDVCRLLKVNRINMELYDSPTHYIEVMAPDALAAIRKQIALTEHGLYVVIAQTRNSELSKKFMAFVYNVLNELRLKGQVKLEKIIKIMTAKLKEAKETKKNDDALILQSKETMVRDGKKIDKLRNEATQPKGGVPVGSNLDCLKMWQTTDSKLKTFYLIAKDEANSNMLFAHSVRMGQELKIDKHVSLDESDHSYLVEDHGGYPENDDTTLWRIASKPERKENIYKIYALPGTTSKNVHEMLRDAGYGIKNKKTDKWMANRFVGTYDEISAHMNTIIVNKCIDAEY